ncbi:putative transcriptional regulatory protein [Vanrija pseudolonga]|uniref:Purtative transcriptional regulatory protein n=1 Tax=Vanrija pseudolonga TaxID=143232 RepID=A0AAF0Y9L6_9TREE|nr:purtative transcriptional regulatory protein [Vanrija pseudolonga]
MAPVPIAPKPPSPESSSASSRVLASAPVVERKKRGRKRYSCAECRRLKLKCSKVWPCTMCERRGCASICPEGVLERERPRPKQQEDLSKEQMAHRIAVLEAALSSSASSRHAHAAPIRPPASPRVSPTIRRISPLPKAEIIAPPGTLSGAGGETRYVGSLAGSAYLRERDAVLPQLPTLATSFDGRQFAAPRRLSPEAASMMRSESGAARAKAFLPSWEEAGHMLQSYWDHVNWIHQTIPRATLDAYLASAYDPDAATAPHALACVFLAMALGVLFDIARAPFHPRGRELFLIAQDILHRSPSKPSVALVQAQVLLGTYILNDNDADGAERYWTILGSAIKSAQSVGLHRDGAAFGLSPAEVDERRVLFWELMEYDRTQALSFGRPCGLSNRHADTRFLERSDSLPDESGYHAAKHRLVRMLEAVIDVQVQPTPVSYATVVELDGQLQEFRRTLPESLMSNVAIQDLPLDTDQHPHLVLQRLGIRLLIAETRLHLNRAAFVQALKTNPLAPSQSPFSGSFVALYESAQEIVQVVKQLVLYSPALAERWWFFWFHVFSAAVCLAAIAIEAPTCGFATPAFSGLSIVCDLSAAARDGCRVKEGLGTLLGLRRRARDRLEHVQRAQSIRHSRPGSASSDEKARSDDEVLDRLLFPAERAKPSVEESKAANNKVDDAIPGGNHLPLWPDTASVLTAKGSDLHLPPILGQFEPAPQWA